MVKEKMRTVLVLVLFVGGMLLGVWRGNAGAAQWAETYGGTNKEVANSIQQTTDGGYIVAGKTYSYNEYTADVWVLKLDENSNVVWQKTYGDGGRYDEWANSIQQTADGGYIVAGYTTALGPLGFDFWIMKLDGSGNVSWQKTYSGTSKESANSIQQTDDDADGQKDDGYIVAGYTDSLGGGGGYDAWVLKLDGSGNVVWQKTYGGTNPDFALSIQQTTDAGYIVAGYTGYFFGEFGGDLWVLKLDGSGNVSWQKTYGGTKTDRAYSVHQTTDGGYIVAGYTDSFGAGNFDFWVLKLDGYGSITWQKTYGGTNRDVANSIHQTMDGGYIVAGYTDSFGSGDYDFWILKLDWTGSIVWQKTYGGTNRDWAYSVQQTMDGGYIVAGETTSFGAGGGDVWVLKLDSSGQISGCGAMRTSSAAVAVTGVRGWNSAARIGYPKPTIWNTYIAGALSSVTKTEVCYYTPKIFIEPIRPPDFFYKNKLLYPFVIPK